MLLYPQEPELAAGVLLLLQSSRCCCRVGFVQTTALPRWLRPFRCWVQLQRSPCKPPHGSSVAGRLSLSLLSCWQPLATQLLRTMWMLTYRKGTSTAAAAVPAAVKAASSSGSSSSNSLAWRDKCGAKLAVRRRVRSLITSSGSWGRRQRQWLLLPLMHRVWIAPLRPTALGLLLSGCYD